MAALMPLMRVVAVLVVGAERCRLEGLGRRRGCCAAEAKAPSQGQHHLEVIAGHHLRREREAVAGQWSNGRIGRGLGTLSMFKPCLELHIGVCRRWECRRRRGSWAGRGQRQHVSIAVISALLEGLAGCRGYGLLWGWVGFQARCWAGSPGSAGSLLDRRWSPAAAHRCPTLHSGSQMVDQHHGESLH